MKFYGIRSNLIKPYNHMMIKFDSITFESNLMNLYLIFVGLYHILLNLINFIRLYLIISSHFIDKSSL